METQAKKRDALFPSYVGTRVSEFSAALEDLSATQVGTVAAAAAPDQSGLAPHHSDHVVMGSSPQLSADAIYLARHVGLRAAARAGHILGGRFRDRR